MSRGIRIFISHAADGSMIAQAIESHLLRDPELRHAAQFWDMSRITPGSGSAGEDRFNQQILDNLRKSDMLIGLMDRKVLSSHPKWGCPAEWRMALDMGKKVLIYNIKDAGGNEAMSNLQVQQLMKELQFASLVHTDQSLFNDSMIALTLKVKEHLAHIMLLFVVSPNGRQDYEGQFSVMPGRKAAGFPVWKQDGGDRYMYRNRSGGWSLADKEVEKMNFDSDHAVIRTSEAGCLPHEAVGKWQLYDGKSWCLDAAIVISDTIPIVPEVLCVKTPNRMQDCEGQFSVLPGRKAAGYPVWKQDGGNRYIYRGKSGAWNIMGKRAEEMDFDTDQAQISTEMISGLPHKAVGKWKLHDGTSWHVDAAIAVSAC